MRTTSLPCFNIYLLNIAIEKRSMQYGDNHSPWVAFAIFINQLTSYIFSNRQDVDRISRSCYDGLLFGRCFLRKLVSFVLPKKKLPQTTYLYNKIPQEHYYPSTTERSSLYYQTTIYKTYKDFEYTTKKYRDLYTKEEKSEPNTNAGQDFSNLGSKNPKYINSNDIKGTSFKDPNWFHKDTSVSESTVHLDYPRNILKETKIRSSDDTQSTYSKEYLKDSLLQANSLESEFSPLVQHSRNPFLFIPSDSQSSHQPKVKFKLRVRTRKEFSCCPSNDTGQGTCKTISEDCQNLIRNRNYVYCKRSSTRQVWKIFRRFCN